jgi:hypothetical protein
MKPRNENSEPNTFQEDISRIFPLAGYFMSHFFQTIGIAVPLLGCLGYAIGKSFFDGWDAAAGLRATLFPSDAYVLILQGLKLQTPWYWALGSICVLVVIIKLTALFDACYERRRRKKIIMLARHERPRGEHRRCWRMLQQYGCERPKVHPAKKKQRFALSYTAPILTMLMILMAVIGGSLIYAFLKVVFLDEAHAAGVREYIGIHALVTGKSPPRFGNVPDPKLLEFACAVKGSMWKYRSVTLTEASGDSKGDGKNSNIGYLLRSAGNTFLFLTPEGSIIKSYGDSGFEMKESDDRPISDLAERCPSPKN